MPNERPPAMSALDTISKKVKPLSHRRVTGGFEVAGYGFVGAREDLHHGGPLASRPMKRKGPAFFAHPLRGDGVIATVFKKGEGGEPELSAFSVTGDGCERIGRVMMKHFTGGATRSPAFLLSRLDVDPAYRRKFVATAIVGEVLKALPRAGKGVMTLYIDPEGPPEARRFWSSLGFRVTPGMREGVELTRKALKQAERDRASEKRYAELLDATHTKRK